MAARSFRISLSLFSLLLFLEPVSRAQVAPAASAEPLKLQARIIYTGRLMGYFRLPNLQTTAPGLKCPLTPDPKADTDAKNFLDAIEQAQKDGKFTRRDMVLVGMGDNFAPELGARVFSDPPTPIPGNPQQFYPRGKDYYNWNPGFPGRTSNVGWISVRDQQPEGLENMLKAGVGYVPVDNVGCFLLAADYDAIVPGKHDFYFGPERLRYLARFLADGNKHGFKPVQMLATNLVIRTDFASVHTSLPDSNRRPPFDSEDAHFKPQNLSEGKGALPWLRYIRFGHAFTWSNSEEAKKEMKNVTSKLCWTEPRDADHYPDPASAGKDSCAPIEPKWRQDVGGQLITLGAGEPPHSVPGETKPKLFLDFPLEIPHRDRTRTYMACLSPHTHPHPSPSGTHPYYCLRFTLDVPFFLFPEMDPEPSATPTGYSNPKPFFWKALADGSEVAVFGVVDPELRQHVGELNFAWDNDDKRFKTEIAVTDPVEALNQLMQYFDDWYAKRNCPNLEGKAFDDCAQGRGRFEGIKILLAQMSAPRAVHLAAQLKGKFHVVFSEADTDYATLNQGVVYRREASAHAPDAVPSRPFVAVPPPVYVYNAQLKQRELQLRALKVERGADKEWTFDITGKPTPMGPGHTPLNENATFVSAVHQALRELARSQGKLQLQNEINELTPEQAMHQLTLHTLKQAVGADVALVQKRDFFFWPFVKPEEVTAAKLPELLDRVIWKGDFIYRVPVKGSALVEVVKQAAQFDQQDAATLSLEDEKGRGLAQLGVFFDAQRKEYLVNGEVLEPTRVYTVATTDYAGLGDTGYPGLGQPAVGRVPLPRDFRGPIVTVSGQVCENLKLYVAGFGNAPCPAPVEAANYFDELHDSPADATKGDTNLHKFRMWSFIFHPTRRPRSGLSTMSLVERNVQEGRVQFFSLEKASLGFTTVRNNVTEAERGAEFGGVSVPQLGAAKSHSFDITLNSRYGALGQRWDWFVRQELRFVSDVQGQATATPTLNLKNNLFATEPGVFWHPSKGKDWPRWGLLISLRDETQLAQPQEKFTLSDAKQSKIVFRHDRTNTVFPHLGFRIQNRNSYFEAGYELGADTRVTGFVFSTDTGPVPCSVAAESTQGVGECIKEHSRVSPPPLTPIITASSTPRTLFATVFRDGAFSNLKLVVPLHPKVSYTLANQFDFFRKHRQNDLSTDTRFRDLWSNAFSFKVIGNLALEPKFDVFFYENKVDGNFFRQVQSTITVSYSFDWFSGGRLWGEAMHYAKPMQ